MPAGYREPASAAGYVRSLMYGIWVAVNATTSVSGSSRKTTVKLWKSRPAAPMISTRRGMPAGSFRLGWCDARDGPGRPPRTPLFGADCTPAARAPGSDVDRAERTREMAHADMPAAGRGAEQQSPPRRHPQHRIHVVRGRPIRIRDLDRHVEEVTGEQQDLARIAHEDRAMPGRVSRGVHDRHTVDDL